ncbi:MAG: hypothetical protein AAGF57_00380 [Pseudomonadota bacterium]
MSDDSKVSDWEDAVKAFEHKYDGPIHMLNLLRVREGEESARAAKEYSPKVLSILESKGAKLLYKAESLATVVGDKNIRYGYVGRVSVNRCIQ